MGCSTCGFVELKKKALPTKGRAISYFSSFSGTTMRAIQAWAVRTAHTGGTLTRVQRLDFIGTSRVESLMAFSPPMRV